MAEDPTTARAALLRGDEARDRRDWSCAAQYYQEHLRARPENFAIWVQLGHALKELGRRVDALVAYSEALRLNDRDADLLLNIGHLHKVMGHRDEAIAYYRRSASLNRNGHALNELHILGLTVENSDLSASLATSRSAAAGAKRGLLNLFGNTSKAAGQARVHGDAARDRGVWILAAENYRRYLTARPNDCAIWVQLGHALKESGRYDQAQEAYNQAHRLNPTDADLLLNIGHLQKLMGNREAAISFYRRSFDQDRNDNARHELMGLGDPAN